MVFQYTSRLFVASLLLTRLVTSQCFFPDGSPAEGYIRCDEGARVTSCCSGVSYCLNNGLCYHPGGFLRRDACSDPNWGSECPPFCSNEARERSIRLWICQNPDVEGVSRTIFTCGDNGDNCRVSNDSFDIEAWRFQLSPLQIAAAAEAPDRAVPRIGDALNFIPASPTSGGVQVITATQTTSVTSFVTAAASNRTGYTSAAMTGLGLGIAAPLVLALIGLLFLLRKEKTQNKMLRSGINASSPTQTRTSHTSFDQILKTRDIKHVYPTRTRDLHELDEIHRAPELPERQSIGISSRLVKGPGSFREIR